MMRVVPALPSVLLISVLAGCIMAPPLNTPSGRPEVFIPSATVNDIRGPLIADMAAKGYTLAQDTQYAMAFVKESGDKQAGALLGSQYDDRVMNRARFTFAPLPDGLKVFLAEEMVANYGNAFERSSPLTDGQNLQTELDYLNSVRAAFTKTAQRTSQR